jgi:uncharacterized protein (DUF58 family)
MAAALVLFCPTGKAMLTPRAWWFLMAVILTVAFGAFTRSAALTLIGLTLLLWFLGQWLPFSLRARTIARRLRLRRQVHDERGPVKTLWAGQSFEVRVTLALAEMPWPWQTLLRPLLSLPHAAVFDRIPFGVEQVAGVSACDGPLTTDRPFSLVYTIRCPLPGQARFEGCRVQLADPQGFFHFTAFVHEPAVLRILPQLAVHTSTRASRKRANLLPPPGIHRLRRPGSGSELLDLRDYLPGDPPRTIAWKVSARRDRLITKEFESEVPVRCTLFVDTSSSVRVASARGKPLHRLIEISAAVLQANADIRDLTGLCLFDEDGFALQPPDRRRAHQARMLNDLTDAAVLAPASARVDPEKLLPLAYSFAQEVYPELLHPNLNGLPFWRHWFGGAPRHRRHRDSLFSRLHRHKEELFWAVVWRMPLLLLLGSLIAGLLISASFGVLLTVMAAVLSCFAWVAVVLMVLVAILFGGRRRRLALWRKRLAALLAVQHDLGAGALETLLEDDDQLSLQIQRFLADHQVPCKLPLYDNRGRYRFAAAAKVDVLGKALLQAVRRGRDNELFVLLADLLELDDSLEPLLRAVRVALGRHHHVVVICPWPADLEPPGNRPRRSPSPTTAVLPSRRRRWRTQVVETLRSTTRSRLLDAYQRLRRVFGRLGVPVVCAAGDQPIPLILEQLNHLRQPGSRR